MSTETATRAVSLSSEEALAFHERGFLGPFRLCSREQMAAQAEHCAGLLQNREVHRPNHNRHLDDAVIRSFSEDPAIIGRVSSLLGDVLIWRSNFFNKPPGAKEIPWHQDWNYWPLEAAVVVSAWLAIDDVTIENSAPQFLPGSHKKQIPHIAAPGGMEFSEMADTSRVDLSKAVDMVMQAGEFVLFNERTLHHSFANTSNKRRLGLALRYISPLTRVTDYDDHGPQPHVLRVLAGQDRLGFNRLASD